MGHEGVVHGVRGAVVSVRQVPQQLQDLGCHDALLVVLGQVSDELQKLVTLLLGGTHPAPLRRGGGGGGERRG